MLGLDSFSSKACMGKGSHQNENLETVKRGRGQNDSGWQVLANAHWREGEVISWGYPMKLNSLPNEHVMPIYSCHMEEGIWNPSVDWKIKNVVTIHHGALRWATSSSQDQRLCKPDENVGFSTQTKVLTFSIFFVLYRTWDCSELRWRDCG